MNDFDSQITIGHQTVSRLRTIKIANKTSWVNYDCSLDQILLVLTQWQHFTYLRFTKVPWLLVPHFQANVANMYAVGTVGTFGTFRTLKECVAWNLVAYEIPWWTNWFPGKLGNWCFKEWWALEKDNFSFKCSDSWVIHVIDSSTCVCACKSKFTTYVALKATSSNVFFQKIKCM